MHGNVTPDAPLGGNPDPITNILADADDVRRSPRREAAMLRWIILSLGFFIVYQTSTLTLTAETVFHPTGWYHLAAIGGALFIALLLSQLDLAVFVAASFKATGIAVLKRMAGLDLGEYSAHAIAQNIVSIGARCLIALTFALMTAIGVSLAVDSDAIRQHRIEVYQTQHKPEFDASAARIDARIADSKVALANQKTAVAALALQVKALQATVLNPMAGDPTIAAAQTDVDRLTKDLGDAQTAADDAKATATKELNGIASPSTSGRAGSGPKARAASTLAAIATARVTSLTTQLAAAQQHLATLQANFTGDLSALRQSATAQQQAVQGQLDEAMSKLDALQKTSDSLVQHRNDLITSDIEGGANYVPPADGFIAQFESLIELVQEHPVTIAIIAVLDAAAFLLEISFILFRSLGGLQPSVLCALIAQREFLEVARIGEEGIRMYRDLHDGDEPPHGGGGPNRPPGRPAPSPDAAADGPPRRPRGRPRTNPPAVVVPEETDTLA
jgi:hypothetical protein